MSAIDDVAQKITTNGKYLYLYLGCSVQSNKGHTYTLTRTNIKNAIKQKDKLILRKLNSLKTGEIMVLSELGFYSNFNSNQINYLLSEGFDLFGLIDDGLAIEEKNELLTSK